MDGEGLRSLTYTFEVGNHEHFPNMMAVMECSRKPTVVYGYT
jgi:hypothetical protein